MLSQYLSESAKSRLRHEAANIFHLDKVQLTIARASSAAQPRKNMIPKRSEVKVDITNIDGEASLEAFVKGYTKSGTTFIYGFIQQSHSWSRLNITHDAFTTILDLFHIDLTFVDFVLGYGIRIRDDGLDLAGYTRQISANPTNQALCYNAFSCLLYYPAEHGRQNTKYSPWSFRQIAVYNGYDDESNTWVFLQCPAKHQQFLLGNVADVHTRLLGDRGNAERLEILGFVLASASSDWGKYIKHLGSVVKGFNEKASYSIVDSNYPHDYAVGFSDAQTLYGIRHQLLKAIDAIDGGLDILSAMERDTTNPSVSAKLELPLPPWLENLNNGFRRYRRGLISLADLQQSTSKLFFKLLGQRNEIVLKEQSQHLGVLTEQANRETGVMLDQSAKIGEDSKVMRILTTVAMVYLPATLVASFFNSNLIQLVPDSKRLGYSHFQLTSQFWLFPVITLTLGILTVGIILIIWGRTRKY